MTPIEHAKAILGEHMTHYVILAVSPEAPDTIQIRTDDKYAASGILERAKAILQENIVDDGWEIIFDEEDDDENPFI